MYSVNSYLPSEQPASLADQVHPVAAPYSSSLRDEWEDFELFLGKNRLEISRKVAADVFSTLLAVTTSFLSKREGKLSSLGGKA